MRLGIILLFVAVAAQGATSRKPISVLLSEDYVDTQHPTIAPYIDERLLLKSWISIDTRFPHSLRYYLTRFRHIVNKSEPVLIKVQEKIDHLPSEGNVLHPLDSFLAKSYLHGTHVGGILVNGLPAESIRLIPVPHSSKRKLLRKSLAEFETEQSTYFSGLQNIISERHIRLFNASFTNATRYNLSYFRNVLSGNSRQPRGRWLREKAEATAKSYQKEWRQLIERNPETIFVVSAGNNGKDISLFPESEYSIKSALDYPNVILVESNDDERGLTRARFSNYGGSARTIGAPGVDIESGAPENRWYTTSGTSMSVPLVGNRLLRFLKQKMPAQEAIGTLFSEEHSFLPEGRDIRAVRVLEDFKRGTQATSDPCHQLNFVLSVRKEP